MLTGCLILETGEIFKGEWICGEPQAGEVVFNTSHHGYEEIATDPSYFSQILVTTAPLQGNYGADDAVWESERIWIRGFVCLEMQSRYLKNSWSEKLEKHNTPLLTQVNTRELVVRLRNEGVVWGALLPFSDKAFEQAKQLIEKAKQQPEDWTSLVSIKGFQDFKGENPGGPRVALIDFGYKKNILRELLKRCSEVRVFSSQSSATQVKDWNPDGLLLSNGPGDPACVKKGLELVQELLNWKFIFGICMGNQVLAQAVGAKNYKLKFGHRGSNHPIKDLNTSKIYMSAQNHGYAIDESTLPQDVQVTHRNLNDNTVAGIGSEKMKFLGVQFHPESHPGPQESSDLFDFFIEQIQRRNLSVSKNVLEER